MPDRESAVSVSPFYEETRPSSPMWEIGEWQISRCLDSGLVHLANPLTGDDLVEFYSREYFEGEESRKGYASYEADEPILRVNFRSLLNRVIRTLNRDGKDTAGLNLLDCGCAYGYFLDEAKSAFSQVTGIEINDEVAAVGRERLDLTIHSGERGMDNVEDGSMDVVTLWDVIEHLSQPRSVLRDVHRVLRPGGTLFITTGDIGSLHARLLGKRWRLINPPQHISYFSIETMGNLLQDLGFEVVQAKRCGKRVSLAFMAFIVSYLIGKKRTLTLPDWLSRISFHINLFDVMFMVARRSE